MATTSEGRRVCESMEVVTEREANPRALPEGPCPPGTGISGESG